MPEANPFDLSGKIALVTGASRGIGAAIAEGLAGAGAKVIGISRGGAGAGAGVVHKRCDLADETARQALFAKLADEIGSIDILVNAAAVSLPATGTAGELARFRATLEVDVIAPYSVILATLPALRAAGGGSIINVTSINSVRGFPGNPGYVTAKAALAGLTRSLAVDLAADHIRVNALAPGYVRTAMTAASHADAKLHEQRRRHTLLGRWGEPKDMTGAAVFLASAASAYMTGQEIFVDGGWTVNGLVAEGGDQR
jgi:NAD(P)-dependent dehydrogenase (short-subunit alcohol dehydrogenase family)